MADEADEADDEADEALAVDPGVLRTAIDSLPVLISHIDTGERYRFVNQAYSEWFGRPRAQLVGRTMDEVLGPAAYASLKPWVDAALAGRAVRFETLARYKDGGPRHIEANYTPSFDSDGAVDGFFVLVKDISARKRAEEALALSEARLAAVLDSVSDGFHALDADGRLTVFNSASERFYGFSRDDVLGRTLDEVFPGMAGSPFEPMLQAAKRGEHPPPVEAPSVLRPERRIVARASPLAGGGMTIAFTDVTDRWEAERSQRASDLRAREQLEELEAIYESAPVGLAFLSTDLRFERVNRRLAEMNGLPAAAHIGRSVREVVPAIADQVEAIWARLTAGEEVVSHEVTGETPAHPGVERAWLEYWTPLRGPGHTVRGLIVVVEEITERKRAEARTDLLIDELNHRVKNTLSVVQNLARQSFLNDSDPATARHAFEERLLALAAAHNVLTGRHWGPTALREIAATAIGGEGDRIALHGPPVDVSADLAVALSLALHELTTNARKYGALSGEGGRVDLDWAFRADGRVELRWTERGGPPVRPPERQGFGTRMLARAMHGTPKGEVVLTFAPSGVVCAISFAPTAS